jgi:hypothetical protein
MPTPSNLPQVIFTNKIIYFYVYFTNISQYNRDLTNNKGNCKATKRCVANDPLPQLQDKAAVPCQQSEVCEPDGSMVYSCRGIWGFFFSFALCFFIKKKSLKKPKG